MLNPITGLATTKRLDDLIHERIDEGYLVKKDWLTRLGHTVVVLDTGASSRLKDDRIDA